MATLRFVLLNSTLACCNGDVFVGVAIFDGVVDLGFCGVDLAFLGVPCCNGDVFFGVSCRSLLSPPLAMARNAASREDIKAMAGNAAVHRLTHKKWQLSLTSARRAGCNAMSHTVTWHAAHTHDVLATVA